jgi:hypothetical protein
MHFCGENVTIITGLAKSMRALKGRPNPVVPLARQFRLGGRTTFYGKERLHSGSQPAHLSP